MTRQRYLSTTDAAVILGITPRVVNYHVRAGNLRGELVGKTWMIHRDAVARFKVGMRAVRPGPKPGQVAQTST